MVREDGGLFGGVGGLEGCLLRERERKVSFFPLLTFSPYLLFPLTEKKRRRKITPFTFGIDEPHKLVRAGQGRVDRIARNASIGPGEDGGRGVAGELADSCCEFFFFRGRGF